MSHSTRLRHCIGSLRAIVSPAVAFACSGILAFGAIPSGLQGQVGAPTPPTGAAGDPAMRADFMNRAMAMQAQDTPTVLTVTGQGSVEAPSDRARVSLSVVTEAESAQEAANANTARMEGLSATMRALGDGTDGFELRTRDFSVYPVYSTGDGAAREIVGYTVQNTLEVVVGDVLLIGDLLDEALGAGANRVASLRFEVSDPGPLRRQALQAAVGDARAEAEAIAEALGMLVGDALEVQGGANPSSPFQPMMEVQTLRSAVPVEPGSQTVTANVTIQYRLDPRP